MTTADVTAAIRERADVLERYGAEAPARALRSMADELEARFAAYLDEPLNLTAAAEESGYHPDSIGRLLRENPALNVGRKNAPRIRRRHLPRKPATVAQEDEEDASWESKKLELLG